MVLLYKYCRLQHNASLTKSLYILICKCFLRSSFLSFGGKTLEILMRSQRDVKHFLFLLSMMFLPFSAMSIFPKGKLTIAEYYYGFRILKIGIKKSFRNNSDSRVALFLNCRNKCQ